MLLLFPLAFYALGALFFLVATAYIIYSLILRRRAMRAPLESHWLPVLAAVFFLILAPWLLGD
jgi:hypothetical protein